jgi:RimJ/RimL family protein N-acetyltransferase
LAIIDSESGDLVGTITVYFSIEHRTADVGLMLGHKDYRGRGYGTEAWMLTLDYLMTEVRVRKATAGTLRNNFGMIRIIETSDMKLEGTRVKQEIVGGEPMDILQFAKFRE